MELNSQLLIDATLSARLEMTEGMANSRFVDSRSRLTKGSTSTWIRVGGTFAMFDGVDSPMTQTFGLGMAGEVTPQEMDTIEDFFDSKSAPIFHEVSPLAPPELIPLLNGRGYQPIEFTNVLCRPIGPSIPLPISRNPAIHVRKVSEEEREAWAEVSASGWSEFPGMRELVLGLGKNFAATEGAAPMLAELDGQGIGAGVVFTADGVALLAGASTIPEARKQGAQSALLAARLRYAVELGCDLAMMCALPGSPSQRNAQRNGFQIAYTRIKWQKKDNSR